MLRIYRVLIAEALPFTVSNLNLMCAHFVFIFNPLTEEELKNHCVSDKFSSLYERYAFISKLYHLDQHISR